MIIRAKPNGLYRTILLSATATVAVLSSTAAWSQNASPTQTNVSGRPVVPNGLSGHSNPPPVTSSNASESIVVRAQRQLLKEKDSPSAVTELGAAAIAQTGVQGSTATLLRNPPSVYVY